MDSKETKETKENKIGEIEKVTSVINSFNHEDDATYIKRVFNIEKINSLIKFENESAVVSHETKKVSELFEEFIHEVKSVADFIDEAIEYIVNECKYTNERIIGKFETKDLINNYFKLIALIIEANTHPLSRSEKYRFEEILLYFNSSILLNSLNNESSRMNNYYYYKFIYVNEVHALKLNDISNKIKSYDDIKSELYSKVKSEFLEIEKETDKGINRLETQLQEKIVELGALEKRINENNDSAIFVSLDKGYKSFFRSKSIELKSAFRWTLGLGGAVLLPAIVKALGVMGWISIPAYNIYGYIGSATVTFILLYYFRVSYLSYNSIKTELTQISLRRNLCAFINGYSDFAQRNKNSPESLKQFENIIFSNIVSDSKNIPAAYDGMEQLAKLIVSLKAPNKEG
ncbi:hypothetical protein ACLFLC_11015 [Providencia rettgeri]|uniref:hypothetical protein n=1 Tax=Providencia TaxID=586 RepID=UPI001EE77A26|nr:MULTISPECIES: hypothetical protein [Providencia]MCG5371067.1 hypothetical protein [Providencia rettgeri]